ncbi:MAG: DNA mismatch repair endonuclease MutL [Enterobacterales bacterium]|nr:DNA mismatch repair endonuclease MutL [Enterobacterales bacterium]
MSNSSDQSKLALRAKPIHRLDNRLANQIAAGEVVERPASVVKELLENAIDSGATRIDVDIERGGTRLIRVTDNGCGIEKDDLVLALSRHATSKITSINDLAAISSLGFRGEALASIGSVSRLCLTSRTHQSRYAWQAKAEGRDMSVELEPAAATIGTRVEIADLFYNTPARLKFLRAEKTEFAHIEEIFKRHALANPAIALVLKHKGKVVKRIPASQGADEQFNRIGRICGKAFADNCVAFNCQLEDVQIHGWLGLPHFHRSESDLQYVFVNGRPVKDKMLNHAIKQAYQGMLPLGRMATFVIFLSLNPQQIDVNVHPTKHEVRFDQSRMVHDLLVKSVSEALTQAVEQYGSAETGFNPVGSAFVEPARVSQQVNEYMNETDSFQPDVSSLSRLQNYSSGHSSSTNYSSNPVTSLNRATSSGLSTVAYQMVEYDLPPSDKLDLKVLYTFSNGLMLLNAHKNLYLIEPQRLLKSYLEKLLSKALKPSQKPLLFPQILSNDASQLEDMNYFNCYKQLGFELTPTDVDSVQESKLMLLQIPQWLLGHPTELLVKQLEDCLSHNQQVKALIADTLLSQFFSDPNLIDHQLILYCLTQLEFPIGDNQFSRELSSKMVENLFNEN